MTASFAFLLAADRGFSHHLYVAEADGAAPRRVTTQRALGRPAFSPDGRTIAFPGPMTDDSDGRIGLLLVGVDGAGLRRITAPGIADLDPAWSPDGRSLAFVRDVVGGMNPSSTRLYVMPAGGGGQWQRATLAGARDPAWSPDSRRLAFTALGRLYTMGADGAGPWAIAGGGARYPAWSPDGRAIAFVQRLNADRSRLVTVSPNGGTVTVRADPGHQVEDPTWASDGRTLYFVVYAGQGWNGRRNASIWRVAPGEGAVPVASFGPEVVRLAHHPDPPPGTPLLFAATEVTQRTVRLTWQNPSDADFDRAEVRMVAGPTPPTTRVGTLVYLGRTPEALVADGIGPSATYSFAVFARDRGGMYSAPATLTVTTPPPRVPDPPAYVEAVPGRDSVRVSWTEPLNDGGRPITGWTVRRDDGSQAVEVPAGERSAVVTGLRSGRAHVFVVVAHNEIGPSAPSASGAVTPDDGAVAGTFTAVSPRRVVDTRSGAPVSSTADRTVPIPGGAAAVVLTAAVTAPNASGYLTVYPAGTPRPRVSTLNYLVGETVANLAVVPLGAGAVAFGVMAGTAHVFADLAGTYAGSAGPAGGRLNALAPMRLLDTRLDGGGALGPGGSRTVQVTGPGRVPAGAGSVVLNLTAVTPTAATYLTVHPAGETRPRTSVLNVARGETRAVLVMARLSADGRVAVYNALGTAHVVVDVVGYHTAAAAEPGERYLPLTPTRVLDTRAGTGVRAGRMAPEEVLTLPLRGVAGIPSDARTVLLNLTADRPTEPTFLTVWPADRPLPRASALNVAPGRTVANLVLAKLSGDGRVSLRNATGAVHVIGDVVGCYRP